MHKLLKFKHEDHHKHFFTSDWHVFHDPKWDNPIWKMRGYDSAKDAARKKLEKINERVGADDIIWMLGDHFLNATDEQCLEWLSQIECNTIYSLFGNHASNTYRLYKQEVKKQFGFDDFEVYPVRMGNVVFLGDYQEIQIGKQHINLCHFSIHSFNHMKRGAWNIGGHSHNADKTRNPDYHMGKVLDCGWDWKRDVWSFDEVEDVMSTKEIMQEGHH